MSWPERVAILLDGEYVKKVLGEKYRRFPKVEDVLEEVNRILNDERVKPFRLYRVFYYTADPSTGKITHPLTKEEIDLGDTDIFKHNHSLINKIEIQPDMAVRRGTLAVQGWKIGKAALEKMKRGEKRSIDPKDLTFNIQQKGVDMRIGLDIASLTLKRLVSTIVLVSGDADMVPAMKFARREGVRIYLDTLGNPRIRPELKLHADQILL